jgi:hypothetical protein
VEEVSAAEQSRAGVFGEGEGETARIIGATA